MPHASNWCFLDYNDGGKTQPEEIFYVMGRVVVNTDVARNVSTSGMSAGVYVLRLINGNDVRIQKIVVE